MLAVLRGKDIVKITHIGGSGDTVDEHPKISTRKLCNAAQGR